MYRQAISVKTSDSCSTGDFEKKIVLFFRVVVYVGGTRCNRVLFIRIILYYVICFFSSVFFQRRARGQMVGPGKAGNQGVSGRRDQLLE